MNGLSASFLILVIVCNYINSNSAMNNASASSSASNNFRMTDYEHALLNEDEAISSISKTNRTVISPDPSVSERRTKVRAEQSSRCEDGKPEIHLKWKTFIHKRNDFRNEFFKTKNNEIPVEENGVIIYLKPLENKSRKELEEIANNYREQKLFLTGELFRALNNLPYKPGDLYRLKQPSIEYLCSKGHLIEEH